MHISQHQKHQCLQHDCYLRNVCAPTYEIERSFKILFNSGDTWLMFTDSKKLLRNTTGSLLQKTAKCNRNISVLRFFFNLKLRCKLKLKDKHDEIAAVA